MSVEAPTALVTRRLFGAHVVGRAQAQARLSQPVASSCPNRQRDAEVGHDRLTVLEQDVGGFDVTVDDPVFMRVLERTGDLRGKSHRIIHGKLLLPVDSISERLALHIRHHVEQEAIRLRPNRTAAGYVGESGSRWS